MSSRLTWTQQARRDLLDIYELIGTEQPQAADRCLDRIEALARHLAEHPRMGPVRPDIAPELRMLVEKPYLILYRLEGDAGEGSVDLVQIVRVIDGRRDLQSLF
jgi:toxin ParE1/3/4